MANTTTATTVATTPPPTTTTTPIPTGHNVLRFPTLVPTPQAVVLTQGGTFASNSLPTDREALLAYLNDMYSSSFPGYELKSIKTRASASSSSSSDDDYEPKEQRVYPIKDESDILRFQQYFLDKCKGKKNWVNRRNYVFFTVGININLRGGDLLNMKVKNFMDSYGNYTDSKLTREEKTGKVRKLYYADIVLDVVKHWVEDQNLGPDDYLFTSQKDRTKPLQRGSATDIMKQAGIDLNYPLPLGTHTLRKTWAYKAYMDNIENPMSLQMVQEALGHSNIRTTRLYLGFEDTEIKNLYVNHELGENLL